MLDINVLIKYPQLQFAFDFCKTVIVLTLLKLLHQHAAKTRTHVQSHQSLPCLYIQNMEDDQSSDQDLDMSHPVAGHTCFNSKFTILMHMLL